MQNIVVFSDILYYTYIPGGGEGGGGGGRRGEEGRRGGIMKIQLEVKGKELNMPLKFNLMQLLKKKKKFSSLAYEIPLLSGFIISQFRINLFRTQTID